MRARSARDAKFGRMSLTRALSAWLSSTFDEQEAASAFELAFRRLRHLSVGRALAKWVSLAEEGMVRLLGGGLLLESVRGLVD